MVTPIALPDYHGFLDLILTAEEYNRAYEHNGVSCATGRIGERHGTFEAASSDFNMMAVFVGWHGDHTTVPVYLFIDGDHVACLQWLPVARDHKLAIIGLLPIGDGEKALLVLAV